MQFTSQSPGNRDPASESYASLHPALANLEAKTTALRQANTQYERQTQFVQGLAKDADPTTWTARIEKARKNPEDLAAIRVQYVEASLRYNAEHLLECIWYGEMMRGRGAISDAICDAMLAMDKFKKSENWLVPF